MKITIIECMESNPYALFLEISMLQLAEQICLKMKEKEFAQSFEKMLLMYERKKLDEELQMQRNDRSYKDLKQKQKSAIADKTYKMYLKF